MAKSLDDIRSNQVRFAAERVLDALENEEYIEAYISYTSAGSCSIKFELKELGTLRIANSRADSKYIPRWNIYFFPNAPMDTPRKTHWYGGAEIEDAIKHIKSYAATTLKGSGIVDNNPASNKRTLADIMAERKAEQEAMSESNYTANVSESPYPNLDEDTLDMYQDDPDYLAYLNSQAGGNNGNGDS